jgi:hypothetical protein
MTPSLLVPIHIDALLVGALKPEKAMFQWTDLAPDFWKLKTTSYSFGSDLYDVFAEAPDPKPGIHLHFRLPRALTHGRQEAAQDLSFPAIPNRWLVQRFVGEPGAYKYKAWLIRSDADAKGDASAIAWPTFYEGQGKALEVERVGKWDKMTLDELPLNEQDEPARVALTAVGPGHPAFAAYYPACRSVLGFHDPLEGVGDGVRLSYLVTGWYSASADDPLRELERWRDGMARLLAAAEPDAKMSKYTIAYLKNFLDSFRKKQPKDSPSLDAQQSALYSELTRAWLEQHYWNCEDLDKAKVLPSRILCHGLVAGIDWQGNDRNYMQPPKKGGFGPSVFPSLDDLKDSYKVSVGNTPAEALAALLVPGAAVEQDLLAAMQADLIGEQVTAEELRYALHARRFDSVGGGTTFFIQAEADDGERDTAANAEPAPPRQPAVIPGVLQKLLQELNEKQSLCDRLTRMLEDGRWQVYALWYLATNERKSARQTTDPGEKAEHTRKIGELESQLDVFKADFERVKRELKAALRDRNAWYTTAIEPAKGTGKIIDEIGKYPKTNRDGSVRKNNVGQPESKYRLVSSADRPFYKPSEPVIAVSGTATQRRATLENPAKLRCRLSGQVLAGMKLKRLSSSVVEVSGTELLKKLFAQDSLPQANGIHTELLLEVLLLDARHVDAIVALASPADVSMRKDLEEQATTLQRPENKPGGRGQWIGTMPDRNALFNWERNPWIPIFLVWEVSWQSSYPKTADGTLPDQLVVKQWELDRLNGDLKLTNRAHGTGGSTVPIKGYSILTPTASEHLEKCLEKLGSSASTLLNVLRNMSVKLQSLDGFNDGLISQKSGMQLPPLSFQEFIKQKGKEYQRDPIHEVLNKDVDSAEMRNTFRTAPIVPVWKGKERVEPDFLPIRSGQLAIKQLSIVDAFGQTLRLPVDTINESAGKAGSDSMFHLARSCVVDDERKTPSAVTLRPRFTQPMRLRFAWENAGAHAGEKGGSICGWVLPNHLEKSLMIYAAAGKPLGALQQKLGLGAGTSQRAFYWVDVPGGNNEMASGPGLDEQLKTIERRIDNIHLRYFCSWISRLSADAGAKFLELLSESIAFTDQRVPDEDPGIAVLLGRPLALVRASLRFEIPGLPAHRPQLRPIASGQPTADELLDTLGFPQVKWPVRLGDLNALNDGLIGVFKCTPVAGSGGVETSGDFCPAWGQDEKYLVGGFARQSFTIDCVEPLQVTMLIDPQARVHATTGALPRAYLELPPDDAAGARRAREVFFQTAPVLGASPTPEMPRPSDDYGEWSWAYRPDVTHWKVAPKIVEATDRGCFAGTWPTIAEGWLKLVVAPVKVLSFWVRDRVEELGTSARIYVVEKGSSIRLAWSLQEAEALELWKVDPQDGKTIEKWSPPLFPSEFRDTVDTDTTYRIIAFDKGAKSQDAKDLTVKVKT